MDYAYSQKRNKRKGKLKERKKHPYKSGGAKRTFEKKPEEKEKGKNNKKRKKRR